MIDLKNPAWDIEDEYAFWEDTQYIIPTIKHDIRPKGNQGMNTKTKSACTMVWAVNQIIRLFWLDLTTEETNNIYLEVVDYCTKLWYVIGSWWSTPKACNCVVKWWNEIGYERYNKEQVFWVQLYWNNPDVLEALDKWHLVWYTKYAQFWKDQVDWYVYRDKYPKTTGHRLNLKWVEYVKSTWWAEKQDSKYGSQDNYHWAIWENFYIKDIKTYINNWMYGNCYLILPISCLLSSIEEEKQRIALMKAVNAVIAVLTSTRWDLPEAYQELSASYAAALRDQYPEARKLMKEQDKKVYQSVVDFLSYAWKYAGEEEQEKYAELAKYLREKFKLL